jgi:hypothetical protein
VLVCSSTVGVQELVAQSVLGSGGERAVYERDLDEEADAVVQAVDGQRRRSKFEDHEFELERESVAHLARLSDVKQRAGRGWRRKSTGIGDDSIALGEGRMYGLIQAAKKECLVCKQSRHTSVNQAEASQRRNNATRRVPNPPSRPPTRPLPLPWSADT